MIGRPAAIAVVFIAVAVFITSGGEVVAKPKIGLMGMLEFKSSDLSALPQWERVVKKMTKQRKIIARCDENTDHCPSPRTVIWRAKVQSLKGSVTLEMLEEVNRFINTWKPKQDAANYGAADYWASPLEFIDRSGDTEDFAIMKFFTLRDIGIANKDLRIVLAEDTLSNSVHAFVAVRLNRKTYILDTLSDQVTTDRNFSYYLPFYSVNETTRWTHVPSSFSSSFSTSISSSVSSSDSGTDQQGNAN